LYFHGTVSKREIATRAITAKEENFCRWDREIDLERYLSTLRPLNVQSRMQTYFYDIHVYLALRARVYGLTIFPEVHYIIVFRDNLD